MTKSLIQKFQDELEEVVDKYVDAGLKQGPAVGTLEIVKLNLFYASLDEDEEGE